MSVILMLISKPKVFIPIIILVVLGSLVLTIKIMDAKNKSLKSQRDEYKEAYDSSQEDITILTNRYRELNESRVQLDNTVRNLRSRKIENRRKYENVTNSKNINVFINSVYDNILQDYQEVDKNKSTISNI